MLLNQPWATSQMLGLLAQQPPAGQPGQPAPMPAAPMNIPDAAPQQNLLGRVHDAIAGLLGGSAPAGWESVLSPQEIQSAKPGIMQSLGHSGAYETNLERLLALKQAAEHQRIVASRAQMPALQGASREETVKSLTNAYNYAISRGDMEMAKELGTRMDALSQIPSGSTGFTEVKNVRGANGQPVTQLRDKTGKVIEEVPEVPAPRIEVPRNIDPLSPQGIAAQLQLNAGKVAQKGTATKNLPAPLAARVGQFGEMLKKTADLLPTMDALDVNLANSAAQDIATNGIGAFGIHIPGTKGIGSMMMNHSPEYTRYEAQLSPWVLAAAHATSGARINMDQTNKIRESVAYSPSDSKAVKAQKVQNMVDMVNSIAGSLPTEAVAEMEAQMAPETIAMLRSRGYKGSVGTPTSGKPKLTQAQYNSGRARGLSKEKIAQHYDLTGIDAK